MRLIDRFLSYVYTRRFFGPRCPEFEAGCPCCDAWKVHDDYNS
jgi:hypothetical protein